MELHESLEKIKALKKLEDNKKEVNMLLVELGKTLYQKLPTSLVGNSGHQYIKTSILGSTKTIKYKNGVNDLKIDRNGWIHLKYGPYKDIYHQLCLVLEMVVSKLEDDLYDQTKIRKIREVLVSLKGD